MKTGKLPNTLLERLIRTDNTDPSVLVGPRTGVDGAVVALSECDLIAVSDPVTFETDRVGEHLAAINANDIAVMGGWPLYLLCVILLPPYMDESGVVRLFEGVKEAASKYNISLIGGHTEITDAVTRPVVSGTMLGVSLKKDFPTAARPGDVIIQINPVAVEGAVILAGCHRERLTACGAGRELIDAAAGLGDRYGLCIAAPAALCLEHDIRVMHDVTEGGICGALSEMALSSGCDFVIDRASILTDPAACEICRLLGIEILGLIGSGSLLVVVDGADADPLLDALRGQGYEASAIGRAVKGCGRSRFSDGSPWPEILRDELARITES
ncbi:MAG: hypothetical protein IK083_08060 [Abditibacteriota bacterium]|nr:hypothetical protein [Abditibacteriota bacterium]